MLIDFHANPGSRSPEEFAAAVEAAGLDAVVVTLPNTTKKLEAYLDALEDAEILAFGGVELTLDRGALVFVPRVLDDAFLDARWSPKEARPWALDEALKLLAGFQGALLAGHPYVREGRSPLGDRIYTIKGLKGIETRIGRGLVTRDRLADTAADARGWVKLGSSGGEPDQLGVAMTVLLADVDEQDDLVDALAPDVCFPLELDDPAKPRDRSAPVIDRPPPRRDDERGRRDDRGGRGRGRRDDRGGRGGRGGRDRGRRDD
ncbi:MAG: hypothetical protein H6704_03005 [Myxococcales bacterium]|nr:hypothetical protein [Myxococcales bacterium]